MSFKRFWTRNWCSQISFPGNFNTRKMKIFILYLLSLSPKFKFKCQDLDKNSTPNCVVSLFFISFFLLFSLPDFFFFNFPFYYFLNFLLLSISFFLFFTYFSKMREFFLYMLILIMEYFSWSSMYQKFNMNTPDFHFIHYRNVLIWDEEVFRGEPHKEGKCALIHSLDSPTTYCTSLFS